MVTQLVMTISLVPFHKKEMRLYVTWWVERHFHLFCNSKLRDHQGSVETEQPRSLQLDMSKKAEASWEGELLRI